MKINQECMAIPSDFRWGSILFSDRPGLVVQLEWPIIRMTRVGLVEIPTEGASGYWADDAIENGKHFNLCIGTSGKNIRGLLTGGRTKGTRCYQTFFQSHKIHSKETPAVRIRKSHSVVWVQSAARFESNRVSKANRRSFWSWRVNIK